MGKKIKRRDGCPAARALRRPAPSSAASTTRPQADLHLRSFGQAFAGYGFNKSHAAAYALVAYQTAYLKANYPVEFLAASMTLDMGNTDKLNAFRRELDRLGVPILPPDINASNPDFAVETVEAKDGEDGTQAIRYALAALRNVGRQAMTQLAAEREANGPFKSLEDFVARLDTHVINKRQLESLIAAGAFDGINPNRKQLTDGIDRILRHANAAASERESAQDSLFGDAGSVALSPISLPDTPDWLQSDRLKHEFDAIGFYLSAHPLEAYGDALARLRVVEAAALPERLRDGESDTVRLAGAVIGRKERTTSRGGRMAFVHLSDRSGAYEVTAFSETLSSIRDLLDEAAEAGAPVIVTAEARLDDGALRITAQTVERLDKAVADSTDGLVIFLESVAAIENLKGLIDRQTTGRGHLRLVVDTDDQEVEIALPGAYALSPATRAAIKSIAGVAAVREL